MTELMKLADIYAGRFFLERRCHNEKSVNDRNSARAALRDAIEALEINAAACVNEYRELEIANEQLQAKLAAAQGQEPIHWVVPHYGFTFPTEEAAQQYQDNLECADRPIACYSAPIPQQPSVPVQGEPDMFWNHDDPERPYSSIDEFLNDEICNGTELEVGHTRTILRAIRLPNIEIRITAVNDDECEADYEVIAAAPQPKEPK